MEKFVSLSPGIRMEYVEQWRRDGIPACSCMTSLIRGQGRRIGGAVAEPLGPVRAPRPSLMTTR
jgi:hypothetical protein